MFQTPSIGQSFIQAEIGVKSHPPSFIFGYQGGKNFELDPIYNAAIAFKRNFPNRAWYWELGLNYWHTRTKEVFHFMPPETIHDPFIPPSGEYRRQMNYGGLNVGAGYAHRINKSQQVSLSAGLESLIGFASKYTSGPAPPDHPWYEADFNSGTYFGIYLKPTYQFRISQNPQKPWYASVFLKSNILLKHISVIKPIFLWGGGLQISYRLRED